MTYTEKRLEEVLKIAVDRFLGWKLPKDFQPDGGISFKSGVCETIGTHLFTAQQANEMLKYVLEEALSTSIHQALAEERAKVVEVEEKYQELIMAVEKKYEGETRHETALKYIRSAEKTDCGEVKNSFIDKLTDNK